MQFAVTRILLIQTGCDCNGTSLGMSFDGQGGCLWPFRGAYGRPEKTKASNGAFKPSEALFENSGGGGGI